jgi:hypothetical protein
MKVALTNSLTLQEENKKPNNANGKNVWLPGYFEQRIL